MEKIIINGGRRLSGEVDLQGSKNSALPILAASAAIDGVSIIHNCPDLSDVDAAVNILRYIGCRVCRENDTVTVDATGVQCTEIPCGLMREMRSSVIFLGALLSRFGRGCVCAPGGCEIGSRPIDIHLSAFREMGIVTQDGDTIDCTAPDGIKGKELRLSFPSVGATENIMLAALGAKEETVIINAAREPEIVDLADFLNSCGARIKGAGESIITVYSPGKLHSCEHTVIPDRIVASTFMACAACAGGEITVHGAVKEHLAPVIPAFEETGCRVRFGNGTMNFYAPDERGRIKYLRTMPYPGFPTDSQAVVMAAAVTGKGTSIISENIFENRFRHVPELIRMGASIRTEGSIAVIEGVKRLHGAQVSAGDLRGGTALVAAALGAEGKTEINNTYHIYRGCERLAERLAGLGAEIRKNITDDGCGNG